MYRVRGWTSRVGNTATLSGRSGSDSDEDDS